MRIGIAMDHGGFGLKEPLMDTLRALGLEVVDYIQGMDVAIEPAAAGDTESLKWFIEHGQSYLKLLREHIRKEDICLFPAANHRLTEEDQKQLLAAFERVEGDETEHAAHETCLKLANELADRFGVPRADDVQTA
jgi:hemerythrin-like domain-containing protein